MAVRVALLGHHYRGDWDWDPADLDRATDRLERWRATIGVGERTSSLDGVRSCLDADLDTTSALAVLDEEAAAGRAVDAAAALLGVDTGVTKGMRR